MGTKLFLIQRRTYLHQSTMKMAVILITFFLFVFTAEHCTSQHHLIKTAGNKAAVAEPWLRIRGSSRCSDDDVEPWKTHCSSWKRFCYDSMVQAHCRRTCNACGGGGGYASFPPDRVVPDQGQHLEAYPGLYPTECQG